MIVKLEANRDRMERKPSFLLKIRRLGGFKPVGFKNIWLLLEAQLNWQCWALSRMMCIGASVVGFLRAVYNEKVVSS